MAAPIFHPSAENWDSVSLSCQAYIHDLGIENYFDFSYRDAFEQDHRRFRLMIEELKSCPQDQCPEPKEPIIAALKFNYAFDKNLEQLKLGAVRLEQIEMIQAVNLEHRRYWQMVLQAQSSCVYNRRIALKYLSNHDYLEPAPYQFFNTLE